MRRSARAPPVSHASVVRPVRPNQFPPFIHVRAAQLETSECKLAELLVLIHYPLAGPVWQVGNDDLLIESIK